MPNDFNVGNAVKQLIWTGAMVNFPARGDFLPLSIANCIQGSLAHRSLYHPSHCGQRPGAAGRAGHHAIGDDIARPSGSDKHARARWVWLDSGPPELRWIWYSRIPNRRTESTFTAALGLPWEAGNPGAFSHRRMSLGNRYRICGSPFFEY